MFSGELLRVLSISAVSGAVVLGLISDARARITEIDITTPPNTLAFGGATFGVGPYQMINGTVKGAVDPNDPLNAVIVDIGLAPRNAHGMVEYSTDFQLLMPMDLSRGNNRIVYDITNRGSANALTILNSSTAANTTSTSGDPGNGFLMNLGYTILESGWDITVAQGGSGFGVTVPIATNGGKPITGPALEEFDIDANASPATEPLSYPAMNADKSQASLSVRANFGDTPIALPAAAWDYTDSTLTAIKLNPPGTKFGDPNVFGPSGLYEFTYTAVNPRVAGLGFAAIRDLATFFRNAKADDKGTANPLIGYVKFIYTFCSSQPCRTMHDFILLGFNQVEPDKSGSGDNRSAQHHQRAIDGVLDWKAGGSGIFMNYRFSQPTRTHRQHIARWYPEIQFPFANQTLFDPVTQKTNGRLDACLRSDTCPKIFEANSANEYWAKAGSLLTTDPTGHDLDLDRTPNVRYYLFASQPHGAGPTAPNLTKGICQQLENPIRPDPILRALLFDLDEWVSTGREPPRNRIPHRFDGTLVPPLPQSTEGFPSIPGGTYNGILHTGDLWDFGPGFDDGILSVMPPKSLGAPYPALVPKTDLDGNDIAGIRVPDVAVPLATYTGWGLRATPPGETGGATLVDGCDANGQVIPFAATKADRGSDPRPSLQERYGNAAGTNADYVAKVTAAAKSLVRERFLLELPGVIEDVDTYAGPAATVTIPANP
jgi:hypothetical protein